MIKIEEEIKARINALIGEKIAQHLVVDIAKSNGTIIIRAKNIAFKYIVSKIIDIDDILTEILDSDILDTTINISYEGEDQDLRIKISFEYE